MRMQRAVARFGLAMTIAGAGCLLLGTPIVGHAEVGGAGCTAHIAGVDVANVNSQDQGTAIHVQKTDSVSVDLAGEPGQTGVHVDYNLIGGASIGKDGSGTSSSARVSDYVNATGLYLVRGTSRPGGGCTAAALVQVDGNPLSTPIGDAAAGVAAAGAVMVVAGGALAAGQGGGEDASASMAGGDGNTMYDRGELTAYDNRVITRAGADEGNDPAWNTQLTKMKNVGFCGAAVPMALMMTTLAMMGAVPVGAAPQQPRRIPRAHWRPRLSVLGILGGLLGSLGAVALMELNGTVYPTRTWTIEALAGGVLAGLVIPSLGNAIAVWRINRRRAARFARLRPPTAAAAWTATHRVPAVGLPTWPAPDPAAAPGPNLDPGLAVQVVEDRGDWVRVVCENGWSCWVDGRRLERLT